MKVKSFHTYTCELRDIEPGEFFKIANTFFLALPTTINMVNNSNSHALNLKTNQIDLMCDTTEVIPLQQVGELFLKEIQAKGEK